jgi:hypothetical protein
MPEPMEARVREATVNLSAVDGESLLSPQLLARVVSAVLDALAARREGEASRRRDTHVPCACQHGGCDAGESA